MIFLSVNPAITITAICAAVCLVLAVLALILFKRDPAMRGKRYYSSQYHKVTGNTLDDVRSDPGREGEYRIYDALREYEDKGAKFLFNTYIPMARGGTTELDVLMICSRGIFVFESKSRYGWLEGNEKDKYWSQFLFRRNGALIENKLYNPILQNRGHIAHLEKLLGGNVKMWSVIVFSDKTDIKRIDVTSSDTYLTREDELKKVVGNIYWNAKDTLTEKDITSIYFKLYSYARATDAQKEKHIDDIKRRYLTDKPVKGKNVKGKRRVKKQ